MPCQLEFFEMTPGRCTADTQQVDPAPHGSIQASVPLSFLEQAVENNGLGLTKLDPKTGRFVFANPRFCQMLGYSQDELINGGLTFRELTHPDDVDRCTSELLRLFRGEIDSYTIEKRYVLRDKSILPVRVTVTALQRDDANQAVEMIGVISSPADLGFASAFYPLRDHADVASFWTWDFRRKIGNCSDGLKILLGRPVDGPVPSFDDFVALLHPEDRSRVVEEVKRVAIGMVYTSEHRIIRPIDEVRWLNQSVMPVFDAEGDVVGLIGTCLDITDAKRGSPRESHPANTVKIVKQHVDLHWDQPLNVATLAAAAKVNIRTLFKHCSQAWGFTPHEYIKRVRLNHARAILQMGDPSTTVLGTALKCCFQNQGHFARDYRLAFGERPSDTLQRSRRLHGR